MIQDVWPWEVSTINEVTIIEEEHFFKTRFLPFEPSSFTQSSSTQPTPLIRRGKAKKKVQLIWLILTDIVTDGLCLDEHTFFFSEWTPICKRGSGVGESNGHQISLLLQLYLPESYDLLKIIQLLGNTVFVHFCIRRAYTWPLFSYFKRLKKNDFQFWNKTEMPPNILHKLASGWVLFLIHKVLLWLGDLSSNMVGYYFSHNLQVESRSLFASIAYLNMQYLSKEHYKKKI